MKKPLIATAALLLMSTGTAWAEDDDGDGIDNEFDPDYTPATTGGTTAAPSNDAPSDGGGDGGYQWGLEIAWNAVGGIPAAHLLYGVSDEAFIDALLQLDIENQSPEMGDSTSIVDFGIGVGYRMYRDMEGRVHPYLEPFLNINISTDETIGEPKTFGLGAQLGVDILVFDQFTLGGSVGAGLSYTTTEAVNTFAFGLFTSSLNATIWW